MLIGDKIKQLRQEAKMTQPELADKIGVSRSAVASYENNTRQPSFVILRRISYVFNVTTDYLLNDSDNKHSTIDKINVEGLSPEQRAIVVSIVDNFRQTNTMLHETIKLRQRLFESLKDKNSQK